MTIEKATVDIQLASNPAMLAAGDAVCSRRREKKSPAQRIQAAIDDIRDISPLLPFDHGYDLRTILQLVGAAIAARITPVRLRELIAQEECRNGS